MIFATLALLFCLSMTCLCAFMVYGAWIVTPWYVAMPLSGMFVALLAGVWYAWYTESHIS